MIWQSVLMSVLLATLTREAASKNGAKMGQFNLGNRNVSSFDFSLSPRPQEFCDGRDPWCSSNVIYRSIDGFCNNLEHPFWGASNTRTERFLAPQYGDGVGSPRVNGVGNTALPNPRTVSAALSAVPPEKQKAEISLMVMQWGQFLDHDITLTPENSEVGCCDPSPPSECLPIDVTSDRFYANVSVNCLPFARSLEADVSCNTPDNQRRAQINLQTAYIDGSQVYGANRQTLNSLREFSGGRLRVRVITPVTETVGDPVGFYSSHCEYWNSLTFLPGDRNLFPGYAGIDSDFRAGDPRVEEQPGLSSIHALFVRVHNALADRIAHNHPHSDEEWIFQETRRIVGALIQRITYAEFLPAVIGPSAVTDFGLDPAPLGQYFTGYNDTLNPSTPSAFSTAAFRFGHSLVRDVFLLDSVSVPLRNFFFDHEITLTQGSYPSDFMRAISRLPAETLDHFMAEALTNFLFAEGPEFLFGSDLLSRNIHRGRDHGLPPYNEWRKACRLPAVSDFEQLKMVMPMAVRDAFERVYSSVDDIDLFPALISETATPSSKGVAGPTLTCLLGTYFHLLKYGDRFWYESDKQPKPFTPAQLEALQKTSLASLLCAYTQITEMPQQALVVPGGPNKVEDCSAILEGTVPSLVSALW